MSVEDTIKLMRGISIDYVVNGMKKSDICAKYNITEYVLRLFVAKHRLTSKRANFRKAVIDKSIEVNAQNESELLSRSVRILLEQIVRLEVMQKNNGGALLHSDYIGDVVKVIQTVAKNRSEAKKSPGRDENVSVTVEFSKETNPFTKPVIANSNPAPENALPKDDSISVTIDKALENIL